jgi:hypothetical protein
MDLSASIPVCAVALPFVVILALCLVLWRRRNNVRSGLGTGIFTSGIIRRNARHSGGDKFVPSRLFR